MIGGARHAGGTRPVVKAHDTLDHGDAGRSAAPCDALCAILSTGLHRMDRGSMLLDLGVNAELVISDGQTLFAGSCAAGCALGSGAYCASELTRTVAALAGEGLLNARGRLQKNKDPRIREYEKPDAARPVLAFDAGDKLLYQSDLAAFIQSKASVATMIDYMLEAAGLEKEEIGTFYLSGALGNALDPASAVRTGLLPDHRFETKKDAVLEGAGLLLTDPAARQEITEIFDRIRYVQLHEVEDYLELMLPHLRLE